MKKATRLRYVSRLGRWETVGAAMPNRWQIGLDKKDDLLIVAGGVAQWARSKPFRPLTLKPEMVAFGGLPQASSGGALGVVDGALHYAAASASRRKSSVAPCAL